MFGALIWASRPNRSGTASRQAAPRRSGRFPNCNHSVIPRFVRSNGPGPKLGSHQAGSIDVREMGQPRRLAPDRSGVHDRRAGIRDRLENRDMDRRIPRTVGTRSRLFAPDNKANIVASWLLAMSDVTGDNACRDRAEKWFRIMKSRMSIGSSGAYRIWNYWAPAGKWDYRCGRVPKHWIGVHSNAGYYAIESKPLSGPTGTAWFSLRTIYRA